MIILPYIILLVVFFILANIDTHNIRFSKQSSYNMLYYMAIVIMVLFAGCRWFDVPLFQDGEWIIFDYSAYEHVYNNPLSNGSDFFSDFFSSDRYIKSMDFGYVYLSSFFSNYVFSNANLFFLLISAVTITFFAKGLKRNNIQYGIFLILFIYLSRLYFQYNFIMMRQALAMAICWWAIPYIQERRFWKFLLFCCLGGLMHFSGFFFIIAYFFPKFKFSNTFLLITLPILFILSVTGMIDKSILFLVERMGHFVNISDRVAIYLHGSSYSRGINPLNYLEIAPFLYFAVKYRKNICMTENGKFFFNMLIVYTLFMILTMNFMGLTRISSYYIYSYLYITSYVFKNTEIYTNRIMYGYALCIYFMIYGIRFLLINPTSRGYYLFFLN